MLKMSKTQCRGGDECIYYKQGKCKFLHNSSNNISNNSFNNSYNNSSKNISYKDISIKTLGDEFEISSLLEIKEERNKSMLYIRHAEKEYKNGKNEEFSLDPDITEKGKIEAFNKFKLLVDKYGVPEKIITSPYLRTRTTAEIARSVIFEQTNIYVEIEHANELSECLKNQINKDLNICLRPETLIHNPTLHENLTQYHNRIYNHTKKAQYNTWYITHGFNIYTVASIKKNKIKYPDELCGIMIDSDGKITNI